MLVVCAPTPTWVSRCTGEYEAPACNGDRVGHCRPQLASAYMCDVFLLTRTFSPPPPPTSDNTATSQALPSLTLATPGQFTTVYFDGFASGWRSASCGCIECEFNDSIRVRAFERVQTSRVRELRSHWICGQHKHRSVPLLHHRSRDRKPWTALRRMHTLLSMHSDHQR